MYELNLLINTVSEMSVLSRNRLERLWENLDDVPAKSFQTSKLCFSGSTDSHHTHFLSQTVIALWDIFSQNSAEFFATALDPFPMKWRLKAPS
jgi:hypothetical protein